MFVINGNRQPSPSFVVHQRPNDKNTMGLEVIRMLTKNVVHHFNNSVNDIEKLKDLFRIEKVETTIDKSRFLTNFDSRDNYVLVNIEKNKQKSSPNYGVHAFFYVIPKKMIVGKPKQDDYTFKAVIHPEAVFQNPAPETSLFHFARHRQSDIFVRSLTEAKFLAEELGSIPFEKVDAIQINEDFFVNDRKVKVMPVKTDLYTIQLFIHKSEADIHFYKVHQVEITGKHAPVFSDKNVKDLNVGLYKVTGSHDGYLLIERLDSVVSGPIRLYHFIKDNDPRATKFVEQMGLSVAWRNPK